MMSDDCASAIGEHRLEPAQHAIRPPVLRELDRGAHEMALVLLELGLESLEQRERVGGRARESGKHLVVIEPADLARRGLDHDVAERDLAVAAQGHFAVAAHGKDGGAVEDFHGTLQTDAAPDRRARRFAIAVS